MPSDEPSIILKPSSSFLKSPKFFLPLGTILLILSIVIYIKTPLINLLPTKKAVVTPTPTPIFKPIKQLKSLSGVDKKIDLKLDSIDVESDSQIASYHIENDVTVSNIDLTPKNSSASGQPSKLPRLTIQDLKLGDTVLLIFNNSGTRVIQVQSFTTKK